jgi:hypothetical protein
MPFVPGFENDIFISYSQTDNDPVIEGRKGWVDFFEDVLKKRLTVRVRTRDGSSIQIFRDPQLRKFGKFSDQLSEKLSSSAVFVCVLSPGYVGSNWCLHELTQFCKLVGVERVIKVVKTAFDVPSTDPEAAAALAQIEDVLDCRFFKQDAATGLVKDLQPEVKDADVSDFLDTVDIVAQNLVRLLVELRGSQGGSPEPPPHASSQTIRNGNGCKTEQPVVYLAETTRDLISTRDEIRTELLQFNCRVLPEQALVQDAADLEDTIRRHLAQVSLSVHLLGENYGIIPELEQRSIPRIQYDLADELRGQKKLTQVVWLPDGITSTDPRQQSFIEHAKNTTPEFLRSKIEDLKTQIHKELNPESTNVWGDEDSDAINLSLFFHEQDWEFVSPLYSYLTFQALFKVKLPLKDASSFQNHKQFLQTSDAVLLYYGNADEEWFVNIWRLIQRQISTGRNKPVLAKAIYAGQPPTSEKRLLECDDPMIIKNYGTFTPDSLSPFIDRIKAAKGGSQ